MESLHLPSQLTEEEENLHLKYAKLKKKKKALTISRTPKLEKQESSSDSLKRPVDEDAAVATEQAKKLLQSGVIKLSSEKKEQSTFKRSKRLKDNDNKSAVNFHPFSHGDGTDGNSRMEVTRPKPKFNLYDNFVSATSSKLEESKESTENQKRETSVLPQTKRGHTIYVNGPGLSEEVLKKACASFGTIVNISSEFEKNCGFVTFEKSESADEAIERLNGSIVSNVHLKVSLARRQPNVDNNTPSSDPSKSSWSSIAASSSQKGNHRDSRDLIIYGEEDDIF